jgi:hypothetical protein
VSWDYIHACQEGEAGGTPDAAEALSSKHTPGPWEIRSGNGLSFLIWPQGRPTAIAVVPGKAGTSAEANARLLAAAPDLLAACKVALARHKQALGIRVKLTGIAGGKLAEEIAQMEAAVAHAEGGAP